MMCKSKIRTLEVLRQRRRIRTRRRDRRGVLLMVVLSMLALFLLLGTAFLVSSQFYEKSSKEAAKENRTENNPADLLERAMLQVLRDTNNSNSAIRYHSLLRDVYGGDGFIGNVYSNESTVYFPQYAGATQTSSPGALGASDGQFVDIFVADPIAPGGVVPDSSYLIALDRNAMGMPVDMNISTAEDAYAGCIFTMLTGPAAGRSTRIVESKVVDWVGARPLTRLRLMAFPQSDGAPLNVGGSSGLLLQELVNTASSRGHAFMVNGRPYNGTGVGFNRLAQAGSPRLSAVEVMLDPAGSGTPIDAFELALTPNSQFMTPAWYNDSNLGAPVSNVGAILGGVYQPFGYQAAGDQLLYTSYEGPGGSDESYDAVDYQNMYLAHMPLTPRARGGLLDTVDAPNLDSSGNVYDLDSQAARTLINSGDPMRFDLENTIVPSYHRPALINYWNHRLLNAPWLISEINDEANRALAILQPYGADGIRSSGTSAAVDQIVALKRKISLRPIPEDHPNFDGSNPASRYSGTLNPEDLRRQTLAQNGQIRFPFWEAVGPWDVDNDNDGINDSIWVDLGDPVQETENGTLYKPLYAFLIVDMDNRLNLNAHGSPDHFVATNFDPTRLVTGNVGNLAAGEQAALGNSPVLWSSNVMPVGMGWGPGDVTLRSVLSSPNQPYHANYLSSFDPYNGNPTADDYARLLFGRVSLDPNSDAIWGRNGTTVVSSLSGPGRTFNTGNIAATREPELPYEFIGYPVADKQRAERIYQNTGNNNLLPYMEPSSFGTSPDLRGRYATGVDYTGQPVYESTYDGLGSLAGAPLATLVDDSSYEANLSSNSRRGLPSTVSIDDDALFATAEMERLLRAFDPETGTAPSRLYDIVDAFDPNKYVLTVASDPANPESEALALAQALTAINRRQVTTDSYEVPVPADVVPSYITELGADGAPGIAGVDDDNQDSDGVNGADDDVVPFDPGTDLTDRSDDIGEIGFYQVDPNDVRFMAAWSDDFASYTGKSVAEARLVDVLWYRIQRNREQRGLPIYNWNNAQAVAILNNISQQLLPPEVLAGYKMDINRPFGDGRDNNGNGIVDEPIEAGEPFVDLNGDGIWNGNGSQSNAEPFIDLDGNGRHILDTDGDWTVELGPGGDDLVDSDGDGLRDDLPIDNLWADQLAALGVTEPALVDNVMSLDVTGRTLTSNGDPLRDDAHLARQLYARHLYMLTMVLMDEDYIAPYDPYDPSVRRFIRFEAQQLQAEGMAAAAAKIEAQRRYTCRQVAQWAVNCVDFRDSDACNTPFEFDDNPWDGWNCVDTNNTPDDTTDDTYYPLDGDPSTDENHGQVIDWENMATDGHKVVTPAIATINASGRVGNQLEVIESTRKLVWGAERPELLITETAAFHDLRLEDRVTKETKGDNNTFQDDPPNRPQDNDLDQRLAPRGSLFVEIYNPWSGDGARPVELYRDENGQAHFVDEDGDGNADDVNGDGNPDFFEGVLLDRLSNNADSTGKRSPVWRLVVVEEYPGYLSVDSTVPDQLTRDPSPANSHVNLSSQLPDHLDVLRAAENDSSQIPHVAPTNIDWDEMLYREEVSGADAIKLPMSQWQQERTATDNVNAQNPEDKPADFTRLQFAKPYPYIEREVYFTSGDSEFRAYQRSATDGSSRSSLGSQTRSYTDLDGTELREIYDGLNVRIPFNIIKQGTQQHGAGTTVSLNSLAHRFISASMETFGTDRPDVEIAPVMPGRYAVLGSAGTNYRTARRQVDSDGRYRFITTIGRRLGTGADPKSQTSDTSHTTNLISNRRIELVPSANPLEQQLLVGANGGDFRVSTGETYRSGELIEINGNTVNLTSGAGAGTRLDTASDEIAPVVVVPIDSLSISEPAYGYGVRTRELVELEVDSGDEGQKWTLSEVDGEGGFTAATPVAGANNGSHFDTPFDADPEFQGAARQPRSISKYRVIHLQRLADPTMPWNPPLGWNLHDNIKASYAQHDPGLPLNPYLTVDSATVDLTVFNGTASPNISPTAVPQFRSTERGYQASRSLSNVNMALPQRSIWTQDYFLAPNPASGLLPERNGLRRARVPMAVRDDHLIKENHFDFVFRHSLGLASEAFGDIYLRPETNTTVTAAIDPTDLVGDDSGTPQQEATMGSALGAPRPDGSIASTYPWLNWNNRPFVSESELLQVPAWSSSEMLRKFSTMNTQAMNQTNGYDGGRLVRTGPNDTDPLDAEATNKVRCDSMTAGFGHLMNLRLSSDAPARIEQDASGNPVPIGAPNFHRILDYVHTPSRFVATDTLLNPVAFSKNTVTSPDDPRSGMLAPFNRVPDYREPGKINLNTVVGQRLVTGSNITLWSDVFDGLMHRVRDQNVMEDINGTPADLTDDVLLNAGHFGPAWRDVVLSRRGYVDPLFSTGSSTGVDRVELVLDNNKPTFFANPFRSSEAGNLVPISNLMDGGVDVSMLRAHPFRPGDQFAWGTTGIDNDLNGLADDAREAGFDGGDGTAFGNSGAPVPLFSELSSTPAIDGTRNSAMHYMPLTRLDNMTTTRSGVFAVWVTVGYFEVSPAPKFTEVQQKFMNQAGGDLNRARALYNSVYPQGYQLGKELGSDTGDIDRQRAFYMIDRTRPVAFKPGEDVNVENAILLRRRID